MNEPNLTHDILKLQTEILKLKNQLCLIQIELIKMDINTDFLKLIITPD